MSPMSVTPLCISRAATVMPALPPPMTRTRWCVLPAMAVLQLVSDVRPDVSYRCAAGCGGLGVAYPVSSKPDLSALP